MKETLSRADIDITEAIAAEVSHELTPAFVTFGLTENAIVAAGIMVACGTPAAPILIACASLDYMSRKHAKSLPLQI